MRKQNPEDIRVGQLIRFCYGVRGSHVTALVVHRTSSTLKCIIESGKNRGKEQSYDVFDITDCMELFGSSILQNLLKQVKSATWTNGDKSKSRRHPVAKPELHQEFRVSESEQHKRKFHMLQILGGGAKLLCQRTNARAKRRLSRCLTEAYKNR